MSFKITSWAGGKLSSTLTLFLKRPAFIEEAEKVASGILADIRANGLAGVLSATEKFQGVSLKSSGLRVTDREIKTAGRKVPTDILKALQEAHARVQVFAAAGLRSDWKIKSPGGGVLGERFVPLERVGVYVPGGTAPLASTAIMTATLAKVAGVGEIVACTPCGPDGKVNPVLLVALQLAGATEIYRVGGIQAVGLMSFGGGKIRPAQKIVGPGNAYVTAAKRQVYGFVAIDQVAGPSEIAVLADESAKPAWAAADLLSQLEHGSGFEKALLVTNSRKMAKAVAVEIKKQIPTLSRAQFVHKAIANNGLLMVVVPDLITGVKLCNHFAPEHLELMTKNPRLLLPYVKVAGAVFMGHWTPESAGDFLAGPSHVLPTGGAARMFSGLTVEDFRRRTSFVEFSKQDLKDTVSAISTFGEMEGLDGHARAATLRFGKKRND